MQVLATALPGLLMLEPEVFRDQRGSFCETFNQRDFDAATRQHVVFAQDNLSRSVRGVLRGMHYQLPPDAQGKLVSVVRGRIFDVAVDLRRDSSTYRRWVGMDLSSDNNRQAWIPPGFAHGFLVTSDSADVLYKTTAHYAPKSERCLRWDDPDLAIAWPILDVPIRVSPRDAAAPAFAASEDSLPRDWDERP